MTQPEIPGLSSDKFVDEDLSPVVAACRSLRCVPESVDSGTAATTNLRTLSGMFSPPRQRRLESGILAHPIVRPQERVSDCPRPFFTVRVARDPGTIRSLRLIACARGPVQVLV